MDIIKIKNTDIDINSIESIETYSLLECKELTHYLDIVMKSGHVHSFDFSNTYDREQCYNKLLEKVDQCMKKDYEYGYGGLTKIKNFSKKHMKLLKYDYTKLPK